MSSVTHIMNDDLDSAEAHLNKGTSSFHQVRLPRTQTGKPYKDKKLIITAWCWRVHVHESHSRFRTRNYATRSEHTFQ
jgi:hypothetical protein